MNFITLRQSVLADLSTKVSAERIDRAIVQAMKYWRTFPTTFNRQRITLTCTADQDSYGTGASAILPQANGPFAHEEWTVETYPSSGAYVAVPSPILEIRYLRGLSGTTPLDIHKISILELEGRRSSDRTVETPTHWAWWDDEVVFAPVPSGAAVIEGLAIVDLGTPLSKYTSSWATRTPDDTAALNDLFSNGWLEHGFEVLHYQTLAIVYQNIIQGQSGNAQAQACLAQAAAHYGRIRDLEVKRDFPKTLASFLPGMYI